MSLSYTSPDPRTGSPFAHHKLSALLRSFLEPIDPSPALTQTLHLAHLLLLSNHLSLANSLLHALYTHSPSITPADSTSNTLQCSGALENFWLCNGEYERAVERENERVVTREGMEKAQWGKYRECTRTGWMLEHCSLPEPEDPHVWRETEDANMLGMCCRLLAKNKTEGQYPSQERMKEALEVAKKLYGQPQVCVSEWTFRRGVRRHGALIYRRLAVELAVRTGDLECAAEMLGLGLRLDGFSDIDGGSIGEYLMLPGIWDVLPLLAVKGKEGNPYYIEKVDAEVMVKEIVATLELRAREGRQWSLAPGKLGWEELLNRLAEGAWKVNKKEYRSMGLKCAADILFPPATEEEITASHDDLPEDLKEMVRVANGFRGGWHFLTGGISGISDIRIGSNLDNDLENFADEFAHLGMKQDGLSSTEMIELQPGTESDCFYHYIIPPRVWKENIVGREVKVGEYQYWSWAPWRVTAEIYDSVWDWIASCVEEVEGMVERAEKAGHSSENNFGRDEDSEIDESDKDGVENMAGRATEREGDVDEEKNEQSRKNDGDIGGENEEDEYDEWEKVEAGSDNVE